MYWYSETNKPTAIDWRPEVHDSDGLAIWNGAGERIWRPLNNPTQTRASAFADTRPRGFGLLQRDRNFDHYQDGVNYEKRPSLWIEPMGDWGEGSVQLIEIPTDDEIHDNIVAFWVPKADAKAGSSYSLQYRLHWTDQEPFPSPLAHCVATRIGRGGQPGQPRPQGVRKFMVEFIGQPLTTVPFGVKPEVVLTAARGKFSYVFAEAVPNGVPGHWRAQFDFTPEGNEPIDMRLYLKNGDQTTSRGERPRASALGDGNQLDFEVERGVRRDHAAGAARAVGDRRRAGQLGLAARLHLLHAFGPAGNHAVERELGGFAALVGAVELLAGVGEGAAVVHLDHVGGRGRGAGAFLERLVDQAAGRGHGRGLRERGGNGKDGHESGTEKGLHETPRRLRGPDYGQRPCRRRWNGPCFASTSIAGQVCRFDDLKQVSSARPSVMLSSDGKELGSFEQGLQERVKLSQVSPHVVTALISTEDHRFYKHFGLDWRRTASSMVLTLRGDPQGGSTITQQLARNLFPEEIGRSRTLTRKLKEAITALKIEA
eukprot:gene35560-47817_t